MDHSEKQRRALDSLSSQFNIIVLISTFSASLIISFFTFANTIIGSSEGAYQYSMFFAIIGIGFHQLAAIVAARAGMLCFQLSKSLDTIPDRQTEELSKSVSHQLSTTDIYDPTQIEELSRSMNNHQSIYPKHKAQLQFSDIHYFLILCEKLQLAAMIAYFPAAQVMIFHMFHKKGFPIAIYATTDITALVVYRLGFWKISVLWNSLGQIGSSWKKMILSIGRKY